MVLLYFVPALRIVLGVLFIVVSALKFPNLKGFSLIVASYGILPRSLVKPAAYTLPFLEFAVGWWVLSGKFLFYSASAGLFLMLVADFFVIKGFLNKKKLENCGCYGADIKVPLSWGKIVENVVWTILFILLIIASM